MPHSLRVKLKNLQRKGELTDKDIDRIFKALEQEPSEDCISREAVLEKAINIPIAKIVTDDEVICRKVVFVDDIEKLSSVNPQEPKTEHWIEDRCDMYICSGCNHVYTDLSGERYGMHYCPYCGAKMESEGAE